MNKTKIGIFLSLMLVLGFCSSCGERETNSKLLLNEVLINNESNFQDDYGVLRQIGVRDETKILGGIGSC